MNSNTKKDLKTFLRTVAEMAVAMSSFIGTDMAQKVIEDSEALYVQLDKDETIV